MTQMATFYKLLQKHPDWWKSWSNTSSLPHYSCCQIEHKAIDCQRNMFKIINFCNAIRNINKIITKKRGKGSIFKLEKWMKMNSILLMTKTHNDWTRCILMGGSFLNVGGSFFKWMKTLYPPKNFILYIKLWYAHLKLLYTLKWNELNNKKLYDFFPLVSL